MSYRYMAAVEYGPGRSQTRRSDVRLYLFIYLYDMKLNHVFVNLWRMLTNIPRSPGLLRAHFPPPSVPSEGTLFVEYGRNGD